MFHGIQENISKKVEENQIIATHQEDGRSSLERNQSFIDVQEDITEVPVPTKLKVDSVQISNEKLKGKSVVTGMKVDGVQFATVKFQGKSFVMLGETEARWRPKTRAKNKLRLNMMNILNPRLMKKKIIVIEDSSSQEDMEEE